MTRDPSWLASHLRDVPDFPSPGIVFKDLTPLLGDVDAFRYAVDALADHAAGLTVDKVVGIEARGFIFAAPVAYRLGAGFVPGAQGRQAALEDGDRGRTRSSTAPTRSRSTRTRWRPATRCSSSTTCWPPAAPPPPPARWSNGSVAAIVGLAFVIELGFLGGRAKLKRSRHTQPDHGVGRVRPRQHAGTRRPRASFNCVRGGSHAHGRSGPSLAAQRSAAGRRGRARCSRRSASATRRRRPRSSRGPTSSRPTRTGASRASPASPTSSTRWRSPASSPSSASTTSPSPPRCCTTRSRTPASTLDEIERDVRRRRRRHRRRRHQARARPVRLQGGPAGRHDAQDAGGDGQGPAGPDHQARRPAAQHADARRHARLEAAAHRPGDARHLRPAGPPPRHAGHEAAARGPGLRRPAPQALRRDRPHGRPTAAPERDLYLTQVLEEVRAPPGRAAHQRRGDRPPEAPLVHLREDGRARARSSTRSSTWSASGSSSTR